MTRAAIGNELRFDVHYKSILDDKVYETAKYLQLYSTKIPSTCVD